MQPAGTRAEHLRVVVYVLGEDDELTSDEARDYGLTWIGEQPVYVEDETLALACACLGVGREFRARQWAALGDFLALYGMPAARSTCEGIADRIASLSTRDGMRLLDAAALLGWSERPTYEDGDSFFTDNERKPDAP
jgi:hypothetical protein